MADVITLIGVFSLGGWIGFEIGCRCWKKSSDEWRELYEMERDAHRKLLKSEFLKAAAADPMMRGVGQGEVKMSPPSHGPASPEAETLIATEE